MIGVNLWKMMVDNFINNMLKENNSFYINTLNPGSIFGEKSLLDNTFRSTSIIAVDKLLLIVLKKSIFIK